MNHAAFWCSNESCQELRGAGPMIRGLIADLLVIGGAALVGWGLWMIYPPLGLIWGGGVLLAIGALSAGSSLWRS